jgi:hypothetical protein
VPRERFEATEKATMLPPPSTPFDVPMYVDKANHLQNASIPSHDARVAPSLQNSARARIA